MDNAHIRASRQSENKEANVILRRDIVIEQLQERTKRVTEQDNDRAGYKQDGDKVSEQVHDGEPDFERH